MKDKKTLLAGGLVILAIVAVGFALMFVMKSSGGTTPVPGAKRDLTKDAAGEADQVKAARAKLGMSPGNASTTGAPQAGQ